MCLTFFVFQTLKMDSSSQSLLELRPSWNASLRGWISASKHLWQQKQPETLHVAWEDLG